MSRLGHWFCSTGWSGGLNIPGCKTPAKIFRGRLTFSNCPSDPQNETQHTDDVIQCARLIYLAWCEHACTRVLYLYTAPFLES